MLDATETLQADKLTVTESEFEAVDKALRHYLVANAEADKAARAKDEARANLLKAVQKAAPGVSDPFPGLAVKTEREVIYDEKAALEFLLKEENLGAAADCLKVRKQSRGILVGAAIMTPALRAIFEVDDTGYSKAAREGWFSDMPVAEIREKETLAVTVKSVQFGEPLRRALNIVPDEDSE
jgi:hypothetical protein